MIFGTGMLIIVRPFGMLPITYVVVSYVVAFFAVFDALATIMNSYVSEVFNMSHAVLNAILIVAFFVMSFVGTWMELPKYLPIITLVLGVMFSINFMSVTNSGRS